MLWAVGNLTISEQKLIWVCPGTGELLRQQACVWACCPSALNAWFFNESRAHPRNVVVAKMQAQFDTKQIAEITPAIAAYNMVARILVPLGVGT